MIAGIGVDRIAIARIEGSINRFGDRFIKRIYTDKEHEQAKAKGNVTRRLAMLFAAKEAIAKAIGTGFRQGVSPRMLETIHIVSGKPEVRLHGEAKLIAKHLKIAYIHLSLTDDDGVAMAFAIAEKN
ncbi:MAG: holo-ACP synthase [Mariprofundaceae bacterium]